MIFKIKNPQLGLEMITVNKIINIFENCVRLYREHILRFFTYPCDKF